MQEGSLFSISSPSFIVGRFFDDGHSDQCQVCTILIVVLICISLIKSSVEHFFMFVGHLYVFFGEISVQVFSPCFDWVVCFSDLELHKLLVYFGD